MLTPPRARLESRDSSNFANHHWRAALAKRAHFCGHCWCCVPPTPCPIYTAGPPRLFGCSRCARNVAARAPSNSLLFALHFPGNADDVSAMYARSSVSFRLGSGAGLRMRTAAHTLPPYLDCFGDHPPGLLGLEVCSFGCTWHLRPSCNQVFHRHTFRALRKRQGAFADVLDRLVGLELIYHSAHRQSRRQCIVSCWA